MKLRRRDYHHQFIAQQYLTLRHDGQQGSLRKFRTNSSINTIETQPVLAHKIKTINNSSNQQRKQLLKQSKLRKRQKIASLKTITSTSQMNNINQLKHLLSAPHIEHSQLKWAAQLRTHAAIKQKKGIQQIPSAYYKTTQCSKTHHQVAQIPSHNNYNTFMHLTRQGQYPSMGSLKFQTSLRQYQSLHKNSPQLIIKQKLFKTIPIKDKKDYPKLLHSQSLKKKSINPELDLISAFDGHHNYPKYTNQIVRDRNYNSIREMTKLPTRGKLNLPSLGWISNLRSYQIDKN